ncbi:MAG: HI0074 family nucleotidyltransferase substrate-binding subunit [Burkholderiales bacterium]
MTRLSVDALEKALVRLKEGFAEAACYPRLPTVRDGVIQRFEIAMDLSWKLLQRALKDMYQVDEGAVLSKRDIFRQAAKQRLLEDTESWFGHYEARNKTSYIYDSEEAARAFERARLSCLRQNHAGAAARCRLTCGPTIWRWCKPSCGGMSPAAKYGRSARAFLTHPISYRTTSTNPGVPYIIPEVRGFHREFGDRQGRGDACRIA